MPHADVAGTHAIVESPGYAGASYLFESFGANLHHIDVDEKASTLRSFPTSPTLSPT
jgi:GntR family transcriptional regulator/MocR family aminotransferase